MNALCHHPHSNRYTCFDNPWLNPNNMSKIVVSWYQSPKLAYQLIMSGWHINFIFSALVTIVLNMFFFSCNVDTHEAASLGMKDRIHLNFGMGGSGKEALPMSSACMWFLIVIFNALNIVSVFFYAKHALYAESYLSEGWLPCLVISLQ